MKPEIRIYFECLEQLLHYILPLVKEGIADSAVDAEIKFIRKPKRLTKASGSLSAIYSLTTPDILITLCEDKKEIPLLLGEFSEAVITEDHELQRAMGGIAAALSGCIYIKISSKKLSLKEHGGKKDFNPLTIPKMLKEAFNYDGYILGEWPTVDKNPCILKRDDVFLSCPQKAAMPTVEEALKQVIKEGLKNHSAIVANKTTIFNVISPYLKNSETYRKYLKALESVPGRKELISDWHGRKGKGGNAEPRILLADNRLIVKINRFSHAADPDRGVLIFASTLVAAKIVLTRYCVKKKYNEIDRLINGFIKQVLDEGLPKNFILSLKRVFGKNIDERIDLTDFVNVCKKEWKGNKVLSAIFLFSDGMIVHDKHNKTRVMLTWSRKKIFGMGGSMKELLNSHFDFKKFGNPLKILEVKDINEDEVSYIVVHEILRPNRFDIVSVSYPGAQGDAAILPEKTRGRKQSRMYIDIIAWLPKCSSSGNDLTLEESKDVFDEKEIKNLVERLDLFRTNRQFLNALIETLDRLNHKQKLERIFIGVAFGADNIATKWKPYKVDYLVRVFDRDKWQIAYFGKTLKDVFKIVEGKVNLPKVYSVVDSIDEPDLFDFTEDNVDSEDTE